MRGLLTGTSYAALRCLAKLYVIPLPSCRQSKQQRLPLEPCPSQLHHTTTQLSGPLFQHKKCGGSVLGSARALRACHFWGQTLNRRALQPHCAEPRRCGEPAAPRGSSAPSCRCGRSARVRPAPLAQALWKARLLRKMRWSNRLTAPLENYCVKDSLSREDLNFCRVAREDLSLTGLP